MFKKQNLYIILILLLTGLLRFYNLMHDSPYFFNPDERNMAGAITRFRLPTKLSEIPSCLISQLTINNQQLAIPNCNLNPHFFAYGQFPLYLAYIGDQITKPFVNLFINQPTTHPSTSGRTVWYIPSLRTGNQSLTTSFPSAIFWLRFWSALSSTFIVVFVYLITKEITNKFQAPSTKFQTISNNQNLKLKTVLNLRFRILNLFRISDFGFGIYAAILAAFTPGLIQAAHFGTTESLLTFFFLASIYLSFKLLSLLSHLSNLRHLSSIFPASPARFAGVSARRAGGYLLSFIFLLSLTIGLALGSKLTGVFFLVPPLLSLMVLNLKLFKLKQRKRKWITRLLLAWRQAGVYWIIGLLVVIGSIIFAVISSPYNFIEKQNFLSAVFGYEADVATGKYKVFYTKQFIDTTPMLFQAEKIFPYALGWPIFILGILGFFLIIFQSLFLSFFILIFSFLIYLLPNAFLFAKWTRFMVPIFPFFAIFAGYFIFRLYQFTTVILKKAQSYNLKLKTYWKLDNWVIGLLVFISVLPGAAFMSIYTHEDSRVSASRWIYENIPNNSYILFETGNVVDIPLGIPDYQLPTPDYNLTTISFDFYHLDENPVLFAQLLNHLEKADYIFIPSRRIFFNYPRFPEKFPLITKYYQLLFSGRLGFEKVAEFSSYPSLTIPLYPKPFRVNLQGEPYTLVAFKDEHSEETYTVFDHPVIRIYRKVRSLTKMEYKNLFKNLFEN